MSDPDQIEKDLREYLAKEPNLTREDRITYLKTIFHKHLEITKLEHLVPHKDLFLIFAESRKQYLSLKAPTYVSKKILDHQETVYVAVLESFILYLNRSKLLKKLVKFDFRD